MWKPAQRIKYKAVPGRWPEASEAAASLLFSPKVLGTTGKVRLEQRTWVPAMVPWRATQAGEVSADVLDWYGRFARGKPGAIVVEATGIRDVPSGPLLRIGHDRFLPGLKQLVERVQLESQGETRLLIQLIDFLPVRRRPERQRYFDEYLNITQQHIDLISNYIGSDRVSEALVRETLSQFDDETLKIYLTARELGDLLYGYRQLVTDTEIESVGRLPQTLPDLFGQAAERAAAAGFDGVELHYAHAYTMASFLSATNTRTDGYGGHREARVRLPLEVYHKVRQRLPQNFLVGCRFLTEECIAGGNTLQDSTYFAHRFAEAGMDFLSTSRGGKFDDAKQPKTGEAVYPYTGPSGYECMPQYISDEQGPFGRNLAPVRHITRSLRAAGHDTPVVVAGGIHNFEVAQAVLADGTADIIGFARQALADPDWFLKVRSGYGDQVRLCEYSNYCEGLDQKHKQVTCQLWDRLALDEPGLGLSRDGRRRLIAPPWTPHSSTDQKSEGESP